MEVGYYITWICHIVGDGLSCELFMHTVNKYNTIRKGEQSCDIN